MSKSPAAGPACCAVGSSCLIFIVIPISLSSDCMICAMEVWFGSPERMRSVVVNPSGFDDFASSAFACVDVVRRRPGVRVVVRGAGREQRVAVVPLPNSTALTIALRSMA